MRWLLSDFVFFVKTTIGSLARFAAALGKGGNSSVKAQINTQKRCGCRVDLPANRQALLCFRMSVDLSASLVSVSRENIKSDGTKKLCNQVTTPRPFVLLPVPRLPFPNLVFNAQDPDDVKIGER